MSRQKKRIMIVGADGSLGGDLRDIIAGETNWSIIEVTRTEARRQGMERPFNSSDRGEWHVLFEDEGWRPDVVVNTAAMTNVDECERNKEEAWKSNVTLVENLAAECKRHGRKLIQVSSDYIFDGISGPYTEIAVPKPINYYGKTKLAAENACIKSGINHAIIRTMWLYGEPRKGRSSFVTWMVNALSSREKPRVVTDEMGNPTFQVDVAYGIIKIIERDLQGVLNIAGPELMSRWDFAQEVAAAYDLDPNLPIPILSSDLDRPAKRPLKSGLISLRAATILGLRLTKVRDGLEICRVMEHRMAR